MAACQPPPPVPLRIGVNSWLGYDSLVLAQETGLSDRSQIRIVEMMSASDTQRAMADGLLDGAALTLDEALRLAESGVAIQIVALLDESQGGDGVVASPGISVPADLRGKRIAVEESAVGSLVLERLLSASGLLRTDVTVIAAEPAMHGAMAGGGQIDAAVTYEPLKSRLAATGLHPIFDSRQMPGEIVDVLVVSTRALQDRRPQVVQLLLAWDRGRAAMLRRPAEAAKLLAPSVELTAEQYTTALGGLTLRSVAESASLLSGPLPELSSGSRRMTEFMIQGKYLQRQPNWSALLDGGPAAEARGLLAVVP